ncbi:RIC1 domain-containing protein [Citrus sinensis]|uniref:RIC1 domain-containing protein n=1 Tax=Citrus sinensis TaxID=2711 RepID=A0ACB8MQ41_CITSI|nr:RIC1 domain-containing protein [Citrus sinensis]KAH9732546.1 RIC1 domain-containing protein [Citrus sinensis]KAH9787764.1 RIC1 domain-containing protein [Citrus sinensis]
MYMAYGWPQVIPLEQGLCPSSQQIIYFKVNNGLLLIASPCHIELWSSSQHKVRLGKYKRDSESVQREGENLQAVWSPDTKLIAVVTSSLYLHIFKVQITEKSIQIGGKQPSGLFFIKISLVLNEQLPFAEKGLSVSNIVSDNKHMLLGLSDGSLYSISWKGEFYGAFELVHSSNDSSVAALSHHFPSNGLASVDTSGAFVSDHKFPISSAIIWLELCLPMRLLFVLYSNGQLMSCSVSKKGLKLAEFIKIDKELGSGDAVCASIAPEQQILAVGTRRGVVELYDLAESASLIRTVSLYDWGYSMDDTGPVSCIAWTPDNSAFAVGWKSRGLTVWSVSGCRLMSTIRQISLSSISSPIVKPNQDCKYEPLMSGTSMMQWDEYGYRLYAIEEGSSERVLIFSFGKCCLNRGVSGMTYARQVSYISQNWPVQHVAASKDGMFLAVAGLHGLILYDIRQKKWRVFGDITQEQKIQSKGLLWLGKIIVVCNYIDSSNTYELLFYPRYHLDQSSLLCRKSLLAKPIVMDVYEDYILVTYRPFDVHIFHVKLFGELTPSTTPDLQLSTVRELSIMTAKSHPAAMRFIPDQVPRECSLNNHVSTSSDMLAREPARCLILRANGELSLLDLDDGRERELTDSVELFWVTCGQLEEKTSLIEEVSWLDYGYRGMQVWYPSPGVDPYKQEDFLQLDPELEFDREVYPLGLLPNAGVVVGVSQRMSFSACTEFPCFEPTPQAQTILHCLLRHLLQRDKIEEALRLAQLSAEKPHFSHCLEWLLFTVFDAEISRQNINKNQISIPKRAASFSLLEKTCNFIRNFPEYLNVVVIAKLEGPAVSQYSALRLLQATLDECLYELAGELVRFLLRSGREYEQASTDSDKLSPRFLGYFLFPSSYRRPSLDKSTSFKEQSPNVASVKNILESHASYLMSGKELSKLVAFVKGTQFDLVEYLQREGRVCARLENFASGLELIGQKLQMGTLQSRLDAEFLLAHMCSVKFKEWIVVLATLLRRSEVLFDLFRHDMRLWEAYAITLQSYPAFAEYHDLLEALDEKLSSVVDSAKR